MKFTPTIWGGGFVNCVFDLGSNSYVHGTYATFNNCIFIDGDSGLILRDNLVVNCTFFNQNTSPVLTNSTNSGHVINCILVPVAGATDFAAEITSGSLGFFFNNCYYGADGNALTKPFDKSGTAFTPFGGGNLAQDPKMIDPANNNFKPRNQNVLTGGMADVSGNPSQIGAVIRKHQFHRRSATGWLASKRFLK